MTAGLSKAMRRVARTWPERFNFVAGTLLVYRKGTKQTEFPTYRNSSTEEWERLLAKLPVPMEAEGGRFNEKEYGGWCGKYHDRPSWFSVGPPIHKSRRAAFMSAVVAAMNHAVDEWKRRGR